MKKKIVLLVVALALLAIIVAGCGATKADVVAKNISQDAEQFKVARRIVAINGITDNYILEVQGYCSLETANSGLAGAVAVTCKVGKDPATGANLYKKSYVYLSDNVTFVVQQIDPSAVSNSHYMVIFRPQTIIPDITH